MGKNQLLNHKEDLVPVGDAARFLGVSIDTLRRWDRAGTIKSHRPDGKNRFFSLHDLNIIKFSKPLKISDASQQLDLSPVTLRRLEAKGYINPSRNSKGERVYSKECLEEFLESEYFLRQGKIAEAVLEPFIEKKVESIKKTAPASESRVAENLRAIDTILDKQQTRLSRLISFKNLVLGIFIFTALMVLFALFVITLSFLYFPNQTSEFFGFRKS